MGMSWYDLIALWMQQQAIKDDKPDGNVNYTMPDWLKPIMDKYAGALEYTPTRDYVSSYVNSYLQGANAPGGALDYKPTFQTQYMAGNQLPSFPRVDMTKGIFAGDSTGKMPWNAGYGGPGVGGKPGGTGGGPGQKPPPVGPGGNPIGPRPRGTYGRHQWEGTDPGWGPDYYNNPFNPSGDIHGGSDPRNDPYHGNGPRDPFGQLITSMNNTNFTDIVKPNPQGGYDIIFPGSVAPVTLDADQWAKLQANEAAFKAWAAKNMQRAWAYAKENKIDVFKALVTLFLAGGG